MRKLALSIIGISLVLGIGLRAAGPQPIQTATYDQTFALAFELFQAGKFQDAFAQAGAAIQMDSKRYEGYFVSGLSLYKLDSYDLSEDYFRKALDRAAESEKARVREALKLAADKKEFTAHVRAAEQAERDGLLGKAASEYTAAWELLKLREDIGLKAARLWNSLSEPVRSASILRQLLADPQDVNAAGEQRKLYESLKPSLDKVFDERLQAGLRYLNQSQVDQARSAFSQALEVDDRSEPHLHMARIAAGQNLTEDAISQLRLMLKSSSSGGSQARFEDIVKWQEFTPLWDNSRFMTFLTDAYGPSARSRISDLAQQNRAEAERVRLDRERATQRAADDARAQAERARADSFF